jgi:predicted Zn-dependent peptidase
MILSNGLKVLLVEKHEVPLVQINLIVFAGSGMEPTGKMGLASMTADMLDEGAGTRSALELADAIDFLGANISTGSGRHTAVVNLNTPLSKLDDALPLMADIVLKPTFPVEELERKQKARLTALMQWHDEPRAIAAVLFDRTLYGSIHPYGLPTSGDETGIKAMTVKDLKKFHKSYYRPNNATLIVVGDVAAQSIQPKLDAVFGKWKKKKVRQPVWPQVEQVGASTIYLVDKPGAPQSEIRVGRIGVPRSTEDYFPLVVMNTILGGSFTSRLNQNLREEHGYTYGARSAFSFRPLPGPFMAGAAVQTEVTDEALGEFMKELNGILEPVPAEELAKAKNFVALRFPERFQTVSTTAGQLADLAVYGLPDDYFNTYTKSILSITSDDVARVARKYIDASRLAIIIVGDRETVEGDLQALNVGPVKVLSVKEVLGEVPTLPSDD